MLAGQFWEEPKYRQGALRYLEENPDLLTAENSEENGAEEDFESESKD